MVFEELVGAVGEYRGAEEQLGKLPVAHLLHAAVGRFDAARYDAEAVPLDLLGQKVVFGEQSAFMETAQIVENVAVEHHEHPGSERRPEEPGATLVEVADGVGCLGLPRPLRAHDVGRDAVQSISPHLLDAALDQGVAVEFDVGVNEQDEPGL